MTARTNNRQPRADAPATLDEAREQIEALERRLAVARAMAMDLRDWIERHKPASDDADVEAPEPEKV